jgi:hypothetical protein
MTGRMIPAVPWTEPSGPLDCVGNFAQALPEIRQSLATADRGSRFAVRGSRFGLGLPAVALAKAGARGLMGGSAMPGGGEG